MGSHLLDKVRILLGLLEQTSREPGDLPATLQHIARVAGQFFVADTCLIFAMNPITDRIVEIRAVPADLLNPKESKETLERLNPEWLMRGVLERGILIIEDMEATPQYRHVGAHAEGCRSLIALALRVKYHQKPLGVLQLYFREAQQWNAEDLELLQCFLDQASFILQETWQLRRYREVVRIGQEINQDLSTADLLFRRLQRHIAGILDASCFLSLAAYQSQTNTLDLYMLEKGKFIHKSEVPLAGAYEYGIRKQEYLFIRQLSLEAAHLPYQVGDTSGVESKESYIFVPLILRHIPLGVLSIQHMQPNAYNLDDLFLLQLLANHLALALYNMRMYRRLNQLNETGQLLTQQLDSEETLQTTVDKIREATRADVVILYPYLATRQQFVHPPHVAGTLDASSPQFMYPSRSGDIASGMLQHEQPIFAKQSQTLYAELHSALRDRRQHFALRERISSTAAVPLRVNNEPVGVLFINFRQPQRFDSSQRLFIEGLAHFAAIAIKNAQTFGTLSERRERELNVLQNIDRELNRPSSHLDSVLKNLLTLASQQVAAEEAAILLYDPHAKVLQVAAAMGQYSTERQRQVYPLSETRGIARWALEHKTAVRVNNVHCDLPWRDLYIPVADNIVSELVVPLLDEEEIIGVMNFESRKEAAFRQEDQEFMRTLAGQAVLAIKYAQAYDREKRLVDEGLVLGQISREITSQLDYGIVFDLILEKALALTGSTRGSLHLHDPSRNELWTANARGMPEEKKYLHLSLGQGIVGYVARNREVVNVDPFEPPWNEFYLDAIPGTCSELAVPMLAGSELRGVLNVESSNPHNFTERDVRLLRGLADLAVVALQNAERYEQTRKETQRFELLYRVGQELGKVAELKELEQAYRVVLLIANEYNQSQGTIWRHNDNSDEFVSTSLTDGQLLTTTQRVKFDEGPLELVVRRRQTIHIGDIKKKANLPPGVSSLNLSHPDARSLLITPIIFKDQYYGDLELSHKEADCFSNLDCTFFDGLALQLAITIYRLETAQASQEFEQQVQSSKIMSSIGQVSFELTHRWGNDLGLVAAYVDDIRQALAGYGDGASSPMISKKLDNIVQVTGRVLNLSKKLKESLMKPEEPAVIPPQAVLEDARDQVISSLPSNIQIDLAIDENVACVRAVYSQVAEILHNLVSNAIDALHPGGGKVTLKAYNVGRLVALEVIDTGPGIPRPQISKVFDLSFSTKGSSGFGLWSARTNALKNNGDLQVTSQIGQGTTFTLYLPKTEKGKQ